MITALVCLWIGFAIGFLCAAMLHAGRERARGEAEDRTGAALPPFVPGADRSG